MDKFGAIFIRNAIPRRRVFKRTTISDQVCVMEGAVVKEIEILFANANKKLSTLSRWIIPKEKALF